MVGNDNYNSTPNCISHPRGVIANGLLKKKMVSVTQSLFWGITLPNSSIDETGLSTLEIL